MVEVLVVGVDLGVVVVVYWFFCYFCKGEVSFKLLEYICFRCELGFIEEVIDDFSFLGGGGSWIDNIIIIYFVEFWGYLDYMMFF